MSLAVLVACGFYPATVLEALYHRLWALENAAEAVPHNLAIRYAVKQAQLDALNFGGLLA